MYVHIVYMYLKEYLEKYMYMLVIGSLLAFPIEHMSYTLSANCQVTQASTQLQLSLQDSQLLALPT